MASRVELAPVPAITGMRPAACSTACADQLAMLVDVDRGRLAGGADDHDAVGAFCNVEVDQAAQAREVQTAIVVHGRDDGDKRSGNHGETAFYADRNARFYRSTGKPRGLVSHVCNGFPAEVPSVP
jgi:hypothetical protein